MMVCLMLSGTSMQPTVVQNCDAIMTRSTTATLHAASAGMRMDWSVLRARMLRQMRPSFHAFHKRHEYASQGYQDDGVPDHGILGESCQSSKRWVFQPQAQGQSFLSHQSLQACLQGTAGVCIHAWKMQRFSDAELSYLNCEKMRMLQRPFPFEVGVILCRPVSFVLGDSRRHVTAGR